MADHVVKHRFVVNRVTAATMEPRGCIGDLQSRRMAVTPSIRPCSACIPIRSELASVLMVPESRIRVVAGDIGGSFGMKSAVYNEVSAGAAGIEARWAGRSSGSRPARRRSCATPRPATTSPRPSSRSTGEGNFLAMRVKTIAAIGAYLQTGCRPSLAISARSPGSIARPRSMPTSPRCSRIPTRCGPYRGNGRPEAAYVIERLVDLAADEIGIRSR